MSAGTPEHRAEAWLATLPDTWVEVVARLIHEDCRGVPRSAERCVIAVALRKATGDAWGVWELASGVHVAEALGALRVRVVLPPAVCRVVEQFDSRNLPELEDTQDGNGGGR